MTRPRCAWCPLPGLLLGAGLLLGTGVLHGQEGPSPSEGPSLSPGEAFLLSAAVPGSAQLALEEWRWPLYLAAEAAGWYGYLTFRADARDLRAAYRTLAWDVPRQGFADERRDGDFEYYERMARWPASGAFDADPVTSGLQPEPDPGTFNGRTWRLAREIFSVDEGTDPDSERYRRALAYYRDHAVPEGFLWDWGDRAEDQERFGRLIRASDRDFQRATTMVGVLLGNHLLSAVDGYLSARLRDRELGTTRLRVLPGRGGAAAPGWILRVEIAR